MGGESGSSCRRLATSLTMPAFRVSSCTRFSPKSDTPISSSVRITSMPTVLVTTMSWTGQDP